MKTSTEWSELFFNVEGEEMTFEELVQGIQKEAKNEGILETLENVEKQISDSTGLFLLDKASIENLKI